MTAKGKINASKVQDGDRIIVKDHFDAEGHVVIHPSDTKTGEGVHVARVLHKTYYSGSARRPGRYEVITSVGTFWAAPIQTMWLAPEDPAGIKRAHVEAIELNRVYEAYPLAEDARRDLEAEDNWGQVTDEEDAANAVADAQTEQVERWLARHREAGTPRRNWSLIEDGRQADWDEALTLNSQAGKVDNMNNDEDADQAPVENATGSTVVSLLEKVWARIREDHPELPGVVIITGSGLLGGSKWGHFRPNGWKVREEGSALHKDELFLAGEALAKGAAQVLQTMLHEGAHTLAKVRDIQDTSRQNRWHNAAFRKLAAEMGLEHKGEQADKTHGFSFVTLTEETKARYADLLAELDTEIKLTCYLPSWLGGTTEQGEAEGGEKITGKPTKTQGGSSSNNVKLTCTCDEPNIIRASKKVADKMVIRCDDCESLFEDRS